MLVLIFLQTLLNFYFFVEVLTSDEKAEPDDGRVLNLMFDHLILSNVFITIVLKLRDILILSVEYERILITY